MFEQLAQQTHDFDVVHFHTGFLHFPIARRLEVAQVTTLHGRLDMPDLPRLFEEFSDMPLVSISDAQRRPVQNANWEATVYNGLPLDLLPFTPCRGTYLAFLGRISPEKRPDRAIEIAKQSGLPLRIAAKVDPADEEYFASTIKPLLSGSDVDFIGEVDDEKKADLLGGAQALLFPIDWPEPFGMVVIEALACGTPVVAWRDGSIPELIQHGTSGFIVDNLEDAVSATSATAELDRADCRREFEARFTADRMARDYVSVYERLVERAALATSEESQDDQSRRGPQRVVRRRGARTA
jgi:glycosyltransferase involved in cell wall biosynthesis